MKASSTSLRTTWIGRADDSSLSANLPSSINGDAYTNKWHHIAVAVNKTQMKVYVDQYRVFVIPDMHTVPVSLEVGGIGNQDSPLVFTNRSHCKRRRHEHDRADVHRYQDRDARHQL